MTLAKESEIMLKSMKGWMMMNTSIIYINTHPEVYPVLLAIQNKGSQSQIGNHNINVPKVKAKFTYYKCGSKDI